ncbi:hypothetical protein [Niabella hibiscisoli]|uniref:hypothetical protein n=1 Tax=Niabella hibiscisoli TaxID=1825928 RepID=UPI001F0EA46E|nr:hypothetical protein [Niabella hibiscisoli]MCH5718578.1 hypothetical protein [Niabella hibiscisoli]
MLLKPLLTSLLSATIMCATAQTTLAPGDIAFTGLNSVSNTINDFVNTPQSESNREFSFVLLKAVTNNTVIFFTDFGWRSDAQAFQTAWPCSVQTYPSGSGAVSDGVVRWQANGNLPYGTQVVIRCQNNPKANVGTATGFQQTYNSAIDPPPAQYVNLVSGGESIFAYTGTLAAPTLLGGICARPAGWAATLTQCEFTSTPSALPPTLNNALNGNLNLAFAVLPTSGSGHSMRLRPTVKIGTNAAAARATIYTPANWESNGTSTPYPLISVASVLPVSFGTVTAQIKDKNLSVNWETISETNCKQYAVEASVDGSNWTTIGTAASKAPGGNSDTALSYTFNFNLAGASFAFFGLPALLLFIPRRRKYLLAAALLLGTVLVACNKNNNGTDIDTNHKVFVRIVQQDMDGSTSYSKAVEAVVK